MNTGELNSTVIDTAFQNWVAELEKRHLADLTFSEVSRALRALSSAYVERRHKLREGAALAGAGKRSAFALFYGPLHFLLVRQIFRELTPAPHEAETVVDLGCGTGAAGAAVGTRHMTGVDRNPWAVGEAARTYRSFGLAAATRQADVAGWQLPNRAVTVVAAFTMNELADDARDRVMEQLLERVRTRGDRLLIVEPLAKTVVPWWNVWRDRVERAGGRSDQWRFGTELPDIVAKLDRAAGLRHTELTGRSLYIATRDHR